MRAHGVMLEGALGAGAHRVRVSVALDDRKRLAASTTWGQIWARGIYPSIGLGLQVELGL